MSFCPSESEHLLSASFRLKLEFPVTGPPGSNSLHRNPKVTVFAWPDPSRQRTIPDPLRGYRHSSRRKPQQPKDKVRHSLRRINRRETDAPHLKYSSSPGERQSGLWLWVQGGTYYFHHNHLSPGSNHQAPSRESNKDCRRTRSHSTRRSPLPGCSRR